MSNFISCIFAAGLIEIPPESKVTALPTKPSSGPGDVGRLVADRDQPRLLVGAARDGRERAHPGRLDAGAVEHLDGARPASACARSASAVGVITFAGLVLQVAGAR